MDQEKNHRLKHKSPGVRKEKVKGLQFRNRHPRSENIYENRENGQSVRAQPSNEVTERERVHDPRYVHDIEIKTEKH